MIVPSLYLLTRHDFLTDSIDISSPLGSLLFYFSNFPVFVFAFLATQSKTLPFYNVSIF
jgi:hypothetical protein